MANTRFQQQVYDIVSAIPKGKVMTYGQIAALCDRPRAARIVGGIAHIGDPALPWQRVVKKDGSLAEGFPGGTAGHRAALVAEGVVLRSDYRVDMEQSLWRP